MSVLKSEIEKYLLENNFSVVDDVISSDTMFVYKSNTHKYLTVSLSPDPNNDYIVFCLESINDDYKLTLVDRVVLKSLNECKFLMTHCSYSSLFDTELIK